MGPAVLEYRIEGDVLSALSTRVPDAARGRGVAQQLTEAMLDFCRQQQLALRPLCSYTAAFVARHPPQDVQVLE
ncbi:N-acetyltransferase [Pseudoxanthomonas sp. CAU 1598]|uniref:N-acetyltransferase n=2 Tax=Pseudomarimonas arenosa TaxID=2774145 RepID=A0AAW3ZE42_9GAMM|nr:N-acetyltransferase [Pseudomarimonas arenosa]